MSNDVNKSYWSSSVELPKFPELKENITSQILIAGGGISGLMNAYQLAERGYEVTLIEGNELVSGTTANTTARITAQQGLIYSQLKSQKDANAAQLYYESQMSAIKEVERIVNKYNIDCDFKRVDSVIYAEHEKSMKDLKKEEKVYKELSIDGHLTTDEHDLPFETAGELIMKNQAEFHPLKFLQGIIEVLEDLNVTIYEHTRAKNADGNTLTTVNDHNIDFEHLIIATHFPFLDIENFYFNSFKISYGYGLIAETTTPIPEHLSMSGHDGAGLSIRNVVKPDSSLPVLLFGGLGHGSYEQKDMTEQLSKLEHYAGQKTANEATLYAYRAQDLMTADSLPFIGHFNKQNNNYFVAAGFNKYGMTNGVLSSMIISDLIEGKDNMYKELLDPSRKKGTFQQLKQHLTNPVHVAESELKNMTESHPDLDDLHLEKGEGTVAKDGLSKKGVYRDDENYYVVSNRCTHMGCSLGWNNDDKTWDCPCHGSRFNYTGKVIEGPATDNLDSDIRPSK